MSTPDIHIKYADTLIAIKRPVMAEEEARKALVIDPYDDGAHASLAIALIHQKRIRAALLEIKEVLALEPEWPWAHAFHGFVLSKLQLDKSAVTAFRTALRLDPNNAEYWAEFANHLNNSGQWAAANDAVLSGLQVDPEHIGCRLIGAAANYNEGYYDSALVWTNEALTREPENAMAHHLKGLLLWYHLSNNNYSDDPAVALSHLKESLRLDPENAEWQSLVKSIESYLRSKDFRTTRMLLSITSFRIMGTAFLGFLLLWLLWALFSRIVRY